MRTLFCLATVWTLAGCPNDRSGTSGPDLARSANPYHDVTPQKMKDAVEAAQKSEEARDDRKLEEAKQ